MRSLKIMILAAIGTVIALVPARAEDCQLLGNRADLWQGVSVATGSDRQFNTLTRIKLEKTSDARPATVEMYQYRGRILTKPEYDQAIADEQKNTSRFMGGND